MSSPLSDIGISLSTEHLVRPLSALSTALAEERKRRLRRVQHISLVDDTTSPFHDLWTPAQVKTFYGGRGAAKDWSFAEVLVRRMNGERGEEDMLVLCTREYQNSIANSVHRVLRGTIRRLGLDHRFDVTDRAIRCPATRGEFIFKGLHHDVEEIKSTEGVKVTWVAEAQNTSEESWINLEPTVFRVPDAELWVGFNTTDENSPTHRRYVTNADPSWIVHKVNYTENPFFPPLMRKLMERDRANDPQLYQHIWLGMPRRISNAIILGDRCRIEEFSDDLWRSAERVHFGADFGFASDPSTLVRFFPLTNKQAKKLGLIKPDDPHGNSDRLYIEFEVGDAGVEIDDLPALYDTVPGSREWPIRGDSSRPEVISYLKRQGFNIAAAAKWAGSIEDGIAHLRSHVIIIHPRCVKTAAEATDLYRYKVDTRTIDPKTNAPTVLPVAVDAHNHYIDATRYGLDGYIQRRGGLGVWAKLAK